MPANLRRHDKHTVSTDSVRHYGLQKYGRQRNPGSTTPGVFLKREDHYNKLISHDMSSLKYYNCDYEE